MGRHVIVPLYCVPPGGLFPFRNYRVKESLCIMSDILIIVLVDRQRGTCVLKAKQEKRVRSTYLTSDTIKEKADFKSQHQKRICPAVSRHAACGACKTQTIFVHLHPVIKPLKAEAVGGCNLPKQRSNLDCSQVAADSQLSCSCVKWRGIAIEKFLASTPPSHRPLTCRNKFASPV